MMSIDTAVHLSGRLELQSSCGIKFGSALFGNHATWGLTQETSELSLPFSCVPKGCAL
jgi:hypothetical protein